LQATTVVGARCCAQRGPASSASAGANAALIHALRIDFTYAASGLETWFRCSYGCPAHGGRSSSSNSLRVIPHTTQTLRLKSNLWPPAVRSKPPDVRSKAITFSPILTAHGLTILQAS